MSKERHMLFLSPFLVLLVTTRKERARTSSGALLSSISPKIFSDRGKRSGEFRVCCERTRRRLQTVWYPLIFLGFHWWGMGLRNRNAFHGSNAAWANSSRNASQQPLTHYFDSLGLSLL